MVVATVVLQLQCCLVCLPLLWQHADSNTVQWSNITTLECGANSDSLEGRRW